MVRQGGIWIGRRWPAGWQVRHVVETGSTNADLLALAEAGRAGDRTALVADHQTAGRGRLDRRWDAPPGANLLVSLLFAGREQDPGESARWVRRVGVAAVDAVRAVVGDGRVVGLKWPNDVMLDEAKLAGILAARSGATGAVVVGIGLNTSWSPAGAADLGGLVTPAEMLERLLDELERLPDDVHDRYRHLLLTLGRDVRVELPGGVDLVGRAHDVDRLGRLALVDLEGHTHRVDVGDVVHLRPV